MSEKLRLQPGSADFPCADEDTSEARRAGQTPSRAQALSQWSRGTAQQTKRTRRAGWEQPAGHLVLSNRKLWVAVGRLATGSPCSPKPVRKSPGMVRGCGQAEVAGLRVREGRTELGGGGGGGWQPWGNACRCGGTCAPSRGAQAALSPRPPCREHVGKRPSEAAATKPSHPLPDVTEHAPGKQPGASLGSAITKPCVTQFCHHWAVCHLALQSLGYESPGFAITGL